ncbi:hypothetical protein [Dietzia sp. UBA5065]|jgi:hypothetical protein|uniref:hypothetical protein n=1 Tax=Dietzia sp. UBA5065 TaxID=1946422 RepID=UPI0025C60F6F|nr:hypothetical protein [Dietzia sp. UBA5065]HMT48830.1 hypothetical protein [Dietzia sp.]
MGSITDIALGSVNATNALIDLGSTAGTAALGAGSAAGDVFQALPAQIISILSSLISGISSNV